MGIGENIRTFRVDRGMTQEQLAKKAGISRVALGNYEREERTPNLDILEKLAEIFDVSVDIIINLHKLDLGELYDLKINFSKNIPLTKMQYNNIIEEIDYHTTNILNKQNNLFCDFSQRGFLYVLLDKYEYAINDYTNALKRNPEDKDIYYSRAVLYQLLGYKEKSDADYDKIDELLKKENNMILVNPDKIIDSPLANKINLLNDDCIDLISNLVDKLIQDKNNLR
ncbi:TPA: helix-turn-helix domain-containing protein [Clostridioides difficile]|nr:helix-turn-helix domain-containing protein [Clostridioides difficile]HBY3334756.1 helix-turn-helix domain-containing protein [Clostridioides difficile]HBY3443499.1 helix-turn-helix domain-containing protein [Clostridioides difficile]HBY3526254.1 helix-turn-helix domain-containing protein [Clostridioides difficile]HBZ0340486.1 helix-turn-helix domain-containing protein [Clostridioides difficile]